MCRLGLNREIDHVVSGLYLLGIPGLRVKFGAIIILIWRGVEQSGSSLGS